MAGLGDVTKLLGSDTVKTILIWQVAGQIFEPLLAPVVQALQDEINVLHQETPLSPADIVEAVIKSIETNLDLDHEFRRSGLDPDRYKLLVDTAGEPPGLETLLEWARRGIIEWKGIGQDSTALEQGVRESRLKNKWNVPVAKAATRPLDPAQAVAAAVRGTLDHAIASHKAYEAGVDPADFETMYHNAGNPPALGELLELYKRGRIPLTGTGPDVLSVEQGVAEGDTKNKWFPTVAELAVYLPPPRTITAMLREGAISEAMADQLLKAQGLSEELARAYIEAASKGHAQASKDLTKSEVLQLYADGLISADAAKADLAKLGTAAPDAAELIQLQDVKRDRRLTAQVVSRIRTLFVKQEITEQQATEALRESGSQQAEITHLLSLWKLEQGVPIPHLTGAEIASAVYYEALTVAEGLAGLAALGYSAFEAWLALAVRLRGTAKLPARPPLPAWSG